MMIWTDPLNRENIDVFFHTYVPHAYRSAYRILGDSTRTENVLTESFLEVYHKRNHEEAEDLVFFFSDILQKRVTSLASQYPITETRGRVYDRSIDEFTENSILSEIHRKIDSASFRFIELITSNTVGKTAIQTDPFLVQIQNTGLSLVLILQLMVVAIIIFMITFAGVKNIVGMNDIVPKSPNSSEFRLEDLLVPVLDYLPLSDNTQSTALSTDVANPSATTTTVAGETQSESGFVSDNSGISAGSDSTVPSATPG